MTEALWVQTSMWYIPDITSCISKLWCSVNQTKRKHFYISLEFPDLLYLWSLSSLKKKKKKKTLQIHFSDDAWNLWPILWGQSIARFQQVILIKIATCYLYPILWNNPWLWPVCSVDSHLEEYYCYHFWWNERELKSNLKWGAIPHSCFKVFFFFFFSFSFFFFVMSYLFVPYHIQKRNMHSNCASGSSGDDGGVLPAGRLAGHHPGGQVLHGLLWPAQHGGGDGQAGQGGPDAWPWGQDYSTWWSVRKAHVTIFYFFSVFLFTSVFPASLYLSLYLSIYLSIYPFLFLS